MIIQKKLDPSIYQAADEAAPGYLPPDKYEVKKIHKQLRTTLCSRCGDLSNGAMLNAIAGQAHAAYDDPTLISPDELREQLAPLQKQKALIIKVVDILDFNGSFMNRVRDLVGGNPIILIITKADLLPKGTDPRMITEWVTDRALGRNLNVAGVHLVSSRTGDGVDYALAAVLRERRGRAVYILGAANVGKSTFVRAFLQQLKQQDLTAIVAAQHMPIASDMPGTTLGVIPIPAFGPKEKQLFDTAGVLIHHRLNALLNEDELKAVIPRRRLVPYTPRLLLEVADGASPVGTTYLWGAVVRVDVLEAPPHTRLTFVGPASVRVDAMPTPPDPPAADDRDWTYLPPPATEGEEERFGRETVEFMGGLRVCREVEGEATRNGGKIPLVDVAVSGLGGWFTVFSQPGGGDGGSGARVHLRVWTPRGVEAFLRPPMPLPYKTNVTK